MHSFLLSEHLIDAEEDEMPQALLGSLVRKLSTYNKLDDDDLRAVWNLPIRKRQFEAHQVIIQQGDYITDSCLIAEGFAFRSKITQLGERQITSLHIAGDMPDLHTLHLPIIDHDLTALSLCQLGFIPHTALREMVIARPNLAAALWRETLIDGSIFREWLLNLGRRSAIRRMGHLILELRQRLNAIGAVAPGGEFQFPITQVELADCLAISPVHANRVLQELRSAGLISLERPRFRVLNEQKLINLSQFAGDYLHMNAVS